MYHRVNIYIYSWNVYQYISFQKQKLDLPYRPIRVKNLEKSHLRRPNIQKRDEGRNCSDEMPLLIETDFGCGRGDGGERLVS